MGKPTGYSKAKLSCEIETIKDNKNQWKVGDLLTQGGFGSIYIAAENSSNIYDKVIKIEPASNGPLFTEFHFYIRVCVESKIKNWMSEKKLKFLGMPRYISGGKQLNSDNRYLVMDRYGSDLHKVLMETDLSAVCKIQIAINILDILEYIHSREYSHADIKALNILQGYTSSKEVYLVDFGMVSLFTKEGIHVQENPDPKIKHNGTLEFCPRDSHRGLVSCRRSDIESLLFNLIFWLSWDKNKSNSSRVGYGKLPWLSLVENVGDKSPSPAVLKKVTESKEKYMKDTKAFIKEVGLNTHSWSNHLKKVLDEVSNMKYTDEPKYDEIRNDFVKMICEIKRKPFLNPINMNKYREIEWESVSISGTDDIHSVKSSEIIKEECDFDINNSSILNLQNIEKKIAKKIKKQVKSKKQKTKKTVKSLHSKNTPETPLLKTDKRKRGVKRKSNHSDKMIKDECDLDVKNSSILNIKNMEKKIAKKIKKQVRPKRLKKTLKRSHSKNTPETAFRRQRKEKAL